MEDARIAAINALTQFRSDLEYLPASKRGERASISMVQQVRQLKQRLAEALGVPSNEWHRVFLDTTNVGATVVDMYTHTGLWLLAAKSRAPEPFQESELRTPPFGFGAHPQALES